MKKVSISIVLTMLSVVSANGSSWDQSQSDSTYTVDPKTGIITVTSIKGPIWVDERGEINKAGIGKRIR